MKLKSPGAGLGKEVILVAEQASENKDLGVLSPQTEDDHPVEDDKDEMADGDSLVEGSGSGGGGGGGGGGGRGGGRAAAPATKRRGRQPAPPSPAEKRRATIAAKKRAAMTPAQKRAQTLAARKAAATPAKKLPRRRNA